jgi:hypothetical protein
MQRRELLEKLLDTALAMGLLAPLGLAVAHAQPAPEAPPAAESETAAWLEHQLRQLAALDSSEQSVPMFLALEDLADGAAAAPPAATSLNPELLAQFERYADLLLQFKPNADENDAVSLVVLMARQGLVPGSAEMCW